MVQSVNEATFEELVLKSDKPVLVDFWAPWCGPCKTFTPVLEQLMKEEINLKIFKMDIDINQKISLEYKIRGVPTSILYKDGKEIGRNVGAASLSQIKKFIENTLTV